MKKLLTVILLIAVALATNIRPAKAQSKPAYETATFGMGCFWCSEAIFQRLIGVVKVESGFSGGHVKNPSYEEVCTGQTGHAEVVNVTFDPKAISYKDLLEIFWKMHDPTTLNRQGEDEGEQYRSVIFYHTPEQKQLAETYKAQLNKEKVYPHPIVTAIEPFKAFYKAEKYHQNYFNLNSNAPYCRLVIQPEVDKLEKVFKEKLK